MGKVARRSLVVLLLAAVIAAPMAAATAQIPVTAGGDGESLGAGTVGNSFSLASFAQGLPHNSSSAPVGVYVEDVLALSIHAQPAGNPGFVTSQSNAVSLFGMAAKHGTTGLIAHNYLAGESFFDLQVGQQVVVVSADGTRDRYLIDSVRRLRALSPWSPLSNFVDLDQGEETVLSASQLFYQVYGGSNELVFQTCIEVDGNPVWGRLFVTGKKIQPYHSTNWSAKLPALKLETALPRNL